MARWVCLHDPPKLAPCNPLRGMRYLVSMEEASGDAIAVELDEPLTVSLVCFRLCRQNIMLELLAIGNAAHAKQDPLFR